MSTFKRLLPAPPPSKNAWGVNQSIDGKDSNPITQQNDKFSKKSKEQKRKNNSFYRNIQIANLADQSSNLTEDIEIISNKMKIISFSQSPILPSTNDNHAATVSLPTSISNLNYKLANMASIDDDNKHIHRDKCEDTAEEDDREILISVGKNTKIKKPKFPKSSKIKGGTGLYKYRIGGDCPKEIPPYATNVVNTYPLPFEILPFEAQSFDIIPSPHDSFTTSIGSASSFPNSASPMLVYPQFGIPIYQIPVFNEAHPNSSLPISPISPSLQSPQSQASPIFPRPPPSSSSSPLQQPPSPVISVKKESIKHQIEYYFSTENLCKDTYLRSLFDKSDGSIQLSQLLNFNRMKMLTNNGKYINLVLESIQEIPILELLLDKNDKSNDSVRLVNWKSWII
ncbi:polysome-associated RNA binding protein, putative [Candida dubliniensis CD36]|uniref:Polysome-associated RNA binding protein, putative n=1 Tax=Candida dubliniensis (strain CD36 / ATCC MYA-646 / CBS 7987 / NCPF 3949 / NRRL Y-17841) TaxID=573826 RepID=B9WEQ8_CANDC|nr:polysome-associated RNA binding protein, putative [Candida dubliniensis CD36]CAX43170.1 polysome-associated RNA binding protein, putative [Candida dubliniensis CD36]